MMMHVPPYSVGALWRDDFPVIVGAVAGFGAAWITDRLTKRVTGTGLPRWEEPSTKKPLEAQNQRILCSILPPIGYLMSTYGGLQAGYNYMHSWIVRSLANEASSDLSYSEILSHADLVSPLALMALGVGAIYCGNSIRKQSIK